MCDSVPVLLQRAEIPGSGNVYRLSIGIRQEIEAAEVVYETPPYWKRLADACIEYCKEEHICLSFLAEQGGIRRGDSTQEKYYFPDEVKIYIAEQIFK